MHHSSLDGRIALFIALVLACVFSAAPATAGEIFKCVAKDGTALYQNFPCNIDSIGSVASSSPPKTDSPPLTTVSTTKSNTSATQSDVGEPRIGMTTDEVKKLWGEPEEMVSDEPAEGGRVSNWRYADGRIVQFNNKHRVLAVQR